LFLQEDVINATGYLAPSLKASRQYSDGEKNDLLGDLQAAGIHDPNAQATIGMLARSERIPPDLVACVVQHILSTQPNKQGSILIFTSGVAEIDAIARFIRSQSYASNLEILTLHANQPNSTQKAIFLPSKRRKVIVATNVAETSITIPDCAFVIDTGKVKEIRMVDGLSRLLEVWTSRASAKQRRGRAGRTQEGQCFKLYTRWTEAHFASHTSPEILRIPLVRSFLRALTYADNLTGKPCARCQGSPPSSHTLSLPSEPHHCTSFVQHQPG
jgi:ATP-dependent RNA helicase DHX57